MMGPLQIIVDPLKCRGQIRVVHPLRVNNIELNQVMEEEVGDQIALPFQRWN